MNEHLASVIVFLSVFLVSALLAWLTSPKKKVFRNIKAGECIKPNHKRKPKTWRADDIKIGSEATE